MGSSPVVRARGVVKGYGDGRARVEVLRGLDLDVGAGELVAVLGRSGSGKSTLLHLLGGLDRLDAGTIELDGTAIERLGERELARLRSRRVGFVFQAFHLLPELTALENVLLPAQLARDGTTARSRARALLATLGVAGTAGRLPGSLSGGEQQRVAVARALVNDPPFVLADEPTGNLDADSARDALDLLRAVADDGRAVLLVTHDDAAVELADRVLELRDGRLHP